MKAQYRFLYIITSMVVYVLIGLIEFFCLNDLLDIISTRYFFHVLMALGCLFIINPLLSYAIVDKLPIKPNLKLKGGIKEDLKTVKE
ncbi:MAG: hypothetical protein Q4B60_03190 [Erysipelotrichaceae bacterium]|nr:hypothetical protein [Erysipelotrichaceae bacterium]